MANGRPSQNLRLSMSPENYWPPVSLSMAEAASVRTRGEYQETSRADTRFSSISIWAPSRQKSRTLGIP
jgi:hypothetical protein